MPISRVNGVQLCWAQTGHHGVPLVLVHGSWGDHHNWDGVVPALARTFRVLTYDRRGHSQSERVTTQGSVEEDVADLAALMTSQHLTPAHVVGNSFGALIALKLAAKQPNLFASLTVHEPALITQGDQGPPFFGAILNKIVEMLPHAQRHTFRGAGHVPHLTHPDDFATIVASFVSSVTAARLT